jgi:cobalt-zinc-cadmium efflux system membrane fusion protein
MSAANIKRVARLPACIAAAVLASAAAAPAYVPVAHSALITVEGAATARTLLLRVRRAQDQQPLAGAELSVTIDGRSVEGSARPDGSWAGTLPPLTPASPGRLGIVVAHDGLHEVLEGAIPRTSAPPAAPDGAGAPGGGAGFLSTLMHKQASWWILNVLIVLIGVIAVSRRMS